MLRSHLAQHNVFMLKKGDENTKLFCCIIIDITLGLIRVWPDVAAITTNAILSKYSICWCLLYEYVSDC